jgi:methionyl-tRNA formyltransferase
MKKHQICILLNKLEEYNFDNLVKQYLPKEKFDIKITDKFPENETLYHLIIPWNYHKILKNIKNYRNVVIIHSSDLPQGRGWAPIYYTLKDEIPNYTISCIFAHEKVDRGDIILKASFPILPQYTATFLRKIDNELSFLLIKKIIEKWPDGNITSLAQEGEPSARSRRFPNDNEINTNNTMKQILPHLRGVEKKNPAFFFHEGVKFIIEIYPETEPVFPTKIKIDYPSIGKHEYWSKSK